MMACPEKVLELVERFERNKDSYLSQTYNEAQLREEFINPFFDALGWDTRNTSGKAEAYKDVIHEDAIKIGETTKAPDYSFRIGGQRKFFVETKKPSVNVKADASPAYQIRRYSWSAKLPLAVLTNFEGFAVYDCRQKPLNTDAASIGRILYIRYDEYASRWNEIANIFSKNSIEQGLFDQYVESVKGKKGTTEVDDEFLKEIERWRDELARNIALRNSKYSDREINYAVQKTIDRIIFLRICEDRGVEPYGQLQEISQKENIYKQLMKLFEKADEKYNSGIFYFKEEKGRTTFPDDICPNLQIDDRVFSSIIKNLYYPDCPYEFSVIGADILGNVYEQFLGKVIRLTEGHHAKVEEKPEVKKAGGVYYTPKYIVDYIVGNTVGKLIEGKTPKQIESLKILDPACGSGSFLIGAYQKLLEYHRDWYVSNDPEKHKDVIYQGKGGQWYLTLDEKKRILLNNIHGVDIDEQAVEVAKLNLLLKVMEDEHREAQKRLGGRVLPDLDKNIKCGNSLIGPDVYTGQTKTFTKEETLRINAFDWQKEFPYKFDAVIGNPPYIRIQAMKEWAPQEVEFYKEKYQSATKGNYDIYVVFVEKGLSLIKDGGLLGFILPHKFFQSKYGEPLRKIIADGRHLEEIIHFGDQQVFERATTYTCLMFLGKNTGTRKLRFVKAHDLEKWRTTKKAEEGKISLNDINEKEWNFTIGKNAQVFEKLGKIPLKLGDVATRIYQGPITSADTVFLFEEFRVDNKTTQVFSKELGKKVDLESSILKSVVRSGDIHRYEAAPTVRVLFPYEVKEGSARLFSPAEMEAHLPLAWSYLNDNKKVLENREKGKFKDKQWYRFGRTQNLGLWEQPKLMIPYMVTELAAYLDESDNYYFINVTTGGYGITLNEKAGSLVYICCLLNSRLLDFYFKHVSSTFHGGYFAANKQFIEQLPIRAIDFSNPSDKSSHDKIVSLVSMMLDLHKRLSEVKTPQEKSVLERQIEATDNEINQLVYKLYGLTDEEIRIVEGNVQK